MGRGGGYKRVFLSLHLEKAGKGYIVFKNAFIKEKKKPDMKIGKITSNERMHRFDQKQTTQS